MKEETLQKKLSPLNVWSLALGCIIGWGAFVMPGNTFLVKAGPLGTAIAMGIAAIIMCVIAFNYHYMITKYPIAGGEFAYAKNEFGTTHAFICSWFLGLSYLAVVPLNATALALIGRSLLNDVFQFGFHYSVAGFDIYMGEILLAIAALVLFAVLSIRDVKFAGAFQTVLVFSLVFGVAIIAIAAIFSPVASFSNLSPGFHPESGKMGGILAVIAVAPWAFVGFDTIPQTSEEFNFSPKKTQSIMVFSILFGASVYVILNTVTAMTIPAGYETWNAYIDDLPAQVGLMALPTFHAAYMLLGNFGLIFLGIAVLAAILSGIVGFYMAASRLLYSMSKEKVLPAWFGKLHKKSSTPHHAILFVMAVSLIAPFFGRTALGWIVDMSSIGATIGYAYTSAAAFKVAKRDKNNKIIFNGILGTVLSLVFAFLLLIPIPAFGCSLGKESYICLGLWILAGGIFYCYSVKKNQCSQ